MHGSRLSGNSLDRYHLAVIPSTARDNFAHNSSFRYHHGCHPPCHLEILHGYLCRMPRFCHPELPVQTVVSFSMVRYPSFQQLRRSTVEKSRARWRLHTANSLQWQRSGADAVPGRYPSTALRCSCQDDRERGTGEDSGRGHDSLDRPLSVVEGYLWRFAGETLVMAGVSSRRRPPKVILRLRCEGDRKGDTPPRPAPVVILRWRSATLRG